MLDFNYADSLSSAASRQYMSDHHDHAVELTGRKCYIFMLDKKKTEVSEIYNEAREGRIYLPHFEERALYKTAVFTGSLNIQNYTEAEENTEFEFNFERMVKNIRDLKNKIAGNLSVKNNTSKPIYFDIMKNRLVVKTITGTILLNLNLSDYENINLMIDDAKSKCDLISIIYEGSSEPATSIENHKEKMPPRRASRIEVKDSTYENCGDVIEDGSIILTDHYKAYQVVGGYPTNDNYGENYISWTCQTNTVNLATIDGLPNDYRELVQDSRYSNSKVEME